MTSQQVPVPEGRVAQRPQPIGALQANKRLSLISLRRPLATLNCGDLRGRWRRPNA